VPRSRLEQRGGSKQAADVVGTERRCLASHLPTLVAAPSRTEGLR
jgi:hypothetical protein